MTCNALVIMFSVSSVLPEDSLSVALRRGKQKEKAGADNGATSTEKKDNTKKKESSQYVSIFYYLKWVKSYFIVAVCAA